MICCSVISSLLPGRAGIDSTLGSSFFECVKEPFGWVKTVGGLRKTRHCGRALVEWFFVLTATAYNLIRIPKILAATG